MKDIYKVLLEKYEQVNDQVEPGEEVDMAVSQIDEVIRNATRIKQMLNTMPMNTDIEAWIQSKLTLADDYLVSVAGAMANDFKGIDFKK